MRGGGATNKRSNKSKTGPIPSELTSQSAYYTPLQIASIYGIEPPPRTIGEQRRGIAIVSLGGGYSGDDLTQYWRHLGLHDIPNVMWFSVDGAKNRFTADAPTPADFENAMDIQIAGAICPFSNIYVYIAPNSFNGLYNAVRAAINSQKYPVSVVSISWGAPESLWDRASLEAMNRLFGIAASRGITICCASGDHGATGDDVDFPSSSPNVLSCGGTTLRCDEMCYSTPTTYETAWQPDCGCDAPGFTGTGGGFSAVFSRPSYQNAVLGRTGSSGGRAVPDISANADPNTGWLIVVAGRYYVSGGTSACAPMFAAYLASIGCNRFVVPELYRAYRSDHTITHNISVCEDGGWTKKIGWHRTCGLGSPNGKQLTRALAGLTK